MKLLPHLGLLLLPAAFAQVTAPPTTIHGTVVSRVTGLPVQGLTIRAAANLKPLDTTGFDGSFHINNPVEGGYVAESPDQQWIPAYFDVRLTPEPGPLRVAITPIGSLSGKVVDESGNGIPGVTLDLLSAYTNRVGLHGSTDLSGNFAFRLFDPGPYVLIARPTRMHWGQDTPREKLDTAAPPSPDGERRGWTSTWYPGVTDPSQAAHIPVGPGQDSPPIVLTLHTAPLHRISGVVLDQSGDPKPAAELSLVTAGPYPASEEFTRTAPDGSFQIENVPEGSYRLFASTSGSDSATIASADILLFGHDSTGLILRLEPKLDIAGQISHAESERPSREPTDPFWVQLLTLTRGQGSELEGSADDSGRFLIRDVIPGRYRVHLVNNAALAGFYLASVSVGGQEAPDDEVDLRQGTQPLRLLLRAGGGRVQGTVEKGSGARVILIPETSQGLLLPELARTTPADSQGRYEFRDLPPGTYDLIAFDDINLYALKDPALIPTLTSGATRLRIDPNETKTADLRSRTWIDP